MHVTFNSTWSYDLDEPKGGRRRFNAGWSGEVDKEVADKAIKEGVAAETGKPAKKADAPPAKADDKK